jgi:hypothetical protein
MRILLLITSHLSDFHSNLLKNCWPHVLANSELLRNADTHFYITNTQNKEIPYFTRKTMTVVDNPGYQQGAIGVLHDPEIIRLFKKYDWVIRTNPDVIIYDTKRIWNFMNNPNVDGIFSNCNSKRIEDTLKSSHPDISKPCTSNCTLRRIMTDFMIFRPKSINFTTTKINGNAEHDASTMFRPLVLTGRDRWLVHRNHDGYCRIRLHSEIEHTHKMCRQIIN